MEGFTTYMGRIAVVPDDNIDTDRIIPARYLTRISRFGYGELLFKDVRGPTFPLDQASAAGASVLVVGTNFGCGSSREHAVWAIQQAAFRVVIAKELPDSPGYSDIFRQNAANCGLLLIEIPEEPWILVAAGGNGTEVSVNLPEQRLEVQGTDIPFVINDVTKDALVRGLDLIGTTLVHEPEISRYEESHTPYAPGASR